MLWKFDVLLNLTTNRSDVVFVNEQQTGVSFGSGRIFDQSFEEAFLIKVTTC